MDFGFRRIGIAVGESEHRVATARPALASAGSLAKDADAIAKLARAEEADAVIVGIPYQGEGAGRQAKICLQLADLIQARGCNVLTQDEAGTTLEATAELRDMGWKASQRKRLVDGESARRILERYWSD